MEPSLQIIAATVTTFASQLTIPAAGYADSDFTISGFLLKTLLPLCVPTGNAFYQTIIGVDAGNITLNSFANSETKLTMGMTALAQTRTSGGAARNV